MHVVGIDAGGTKTVAARATPDGEMVAQARRGGANLRTHGELAVEVVLHEVMEAVGAFDDGPPLAVCVGMAGVDRPDEAATVRAILRRLGCRQHVVVVNDALVALVAGADRAFGVCVVAGTGSIVYGVNANGVAARAGGWGPVLADEGSGFFIGRQALAAVMRATDGRGPRTALVPAILQHYGVSTPDALVQAIYGATDQRRQVASLGPVVEAARADGDRVAEELLSHAADELARAAQSVAVQLSMRGEVFPFVLAGGMFLASPWMASTLTARLGEVAPRATVMPSPVEPVRGAVAVARDAGRRQFVAPVYRAVHDEGAPK
jgi:N-acetylglucosamine kinase-like BadF-type ATPase